MQVTPHPPIRPGSAPGRVYRVLCFTRTVRSGCTGGRMLTGRRGCRSVRPLSKPMHRPGALPICGCRKESVGQRVGLSWVNSRRVWTSLQGFVVLGARRERVAGGGMVALSRCSDGAETRTEQLLFSFQLALRGPAGPMGLTGRPGPMVSERASKDGAGPAGAGSVDALGYLHK